MYLDVREKVNREASGIMRMALFERLCGVLSPDLMLGISGTGWRWGEYHSGLDRMLAHVARQRTSKACRVMMAHGYGTHSSFLLVPAAIG